jgi:photosystem II stability/assembly factor-like uncharacterized protein
MRQIVRAFAPLLLCASATAAQDWTRIPLDTSADLYAIENTYLPKHWVVGAGGFGALSNDSRTAWTTMETGTEADLFSVQEPGAFEVYMGAEGGVVRLRVYNQWFDRSIPSPLDYRLFTRSGAKVTAVGPAGRIYRSLDAGNTWNEIPSGVLVSLNGGAGMPQGPAWIVGDEGTILRSLDGASWTPAQSTTTADLYGIAERDFTDLYVVGSGGTILKSSDGGITWDGKDSGTTATLRAISISKQSDDHLIAVGSGGVVLKSVDAGESWCRLDVTFMDLYSVEAVTDTEFLVCGAGGLLLRTTNGGGPCLAPSSVEQTNPAVRLHVSEPYPQPANGSVSMRVRTDGDYPVVAEIFDIAGRTVRAIPSVQRSQQDVIFDWNTGNWATGAYWVRMKVGSERIVRRLVVAR